MKPPFLNTIGSLAWAFALVFSVLSTTAIFAADHGDGSTFSEQPEFDIADFFVFPSMDNGNKRLSFILNVHPNSNERTRFETDISYRLRTRPINGFAKNPFQAIVGDDELLVDCRAVNNAETQSLQCKLHSLKNGVYEELDNAIAEFGERGGGNNDNFMIFGGLAADLLFSDRARVRMPVWEDRGFNEKKPDGSPVWPGVNSQDGQNILSIVVSLDVEKYYNSGESLLAAVSETHRIQAEGERLIQVDRMGRVETTVFILRDTNNPLRDLWNSEDTFNINPDNVAAYKLGLQEGLLRLDRFELSLEGKNVLDWPIPHPWVDLMMHEFLIVDLRHPVPASQDIVHYLDIEIGNYLGDQIRANVVGGRLPNEDVIDRTLTIFINGFNDKPSRGVGVPKPARPAVDAFPFVPLPF